MATTRRIVPSEAMRRELRSGGRAFLQYLCDAGLTGDEASKLARCLNQIRDGEDIEEVTISVARDKDGVLWVGADFDSSRVRVRLKQASGARPCITPSGSAVKSEIQWRQQPVCDWHCDGTPGCAPDDCGANPDSERDCDGCPGVVTRAEHMALANELRETRQAVSELKARFDSHHHKTPYATDGPST